MSIFLEVIVTSTSEALAAQEGGADRLELVRDLDSGGLTPAFETVQEVLGNVSIPVRVMVREADRMSIESAQEVVRLRREIDRFASLPVNGLVLGYLKDGRIDTDALHALVPADLSCGITFHRAFDEVTDPVIGIETLKGHPQIDRVLTRAGEGLSWDERKARLEKWQEAGHPRIQMLFAVGRDTSRLGDLLRSPEYYEVHVGRAVRMGHVNSGAVSAEYVAELKGSSVNHPIGV